MTGSSLRGPGRRLGALVALVLVPSLVPELFGLACPHHMAGAGHVPPASRDAPHHGGDGDHGDPGHAPEPAPPCSCVGECPVPQPPSAPPARVAQAERTLPAHRDPGLTGVREARPRAQPPRLLPWPLGPPAA